MRNEKNILAFDNINWDKTVNIGVNCTEEQKTLFRQMHSGLFSKYLFHPETFRAERVAWKTGKTLTIWAYFSTKLIALLLKMSILLKKNAKIIKVLSVFQATRWALKVSGWNKYLEKSPLCSGFHKGVHPRVSSHTNI